MRPRVPACLVFGHAACSPSISLAFSPRFGGGAGEGAGGLRCLSCDLGDTEAECSRTLGGNRPKLSVLGWPRGLPRAADWKGEVKGSRGLQTHRPYAGTRGHSSALCQAATASGPREDIRAGAWRGGGSPPPQRAREVAFSDSQGWFPPGYHPSALSSIPSGTFSPPSRARSSQVPGAPGSTWFRCLSPSSWQDPGSVTWLHSALAPSPVPSHHGWVINQPAAGWNFIHLPASFPSSASFHVHPSLRAQFWNHDAWV